MAFDPQTQLAHIAVIASETARMAATYRASPDGHWQRPTYCPDWQAAEAVAHLATGADFYAQVIASGRSGEPQLPWGASDAAGARAGRAAAAKKLIEAGPEALMTGFEEVQAQFLAQRLDDGLDGVHVLRVDDTSWAFVVQGKTATSQAQAPAVFDTCLNADAESLTLLNMGRADTEARLRSGALTITADNAKGRRFCETLFRTF